jgi:uracil-DNA glycosylase
MGEPKFKIAIIGEAYGEEEAQWKLPFIGPAGKQLDSILEDAGIDRKSCFVTNVFNLRPGDAAKKVVSNPNDLTHICGAKTDSDVAKGLGPLVPGKYLKSEYLPEVDRLLAELAGVRPNVAVLLGNTACWALLERQAISKIRGTACLSSRLPWLKCIPTYHPSAVLRAYDLRHVTVMDFLKAKREQDFPDLRRPARRVHVAETLADVVQFKQQFLDSAKRIAFDVETDRHAQITCLGFAASINDVLVIPIVDQRKPKGNYWEHIGSELEVWKLVAEILASPAEKVGQNGLYDLQYLWQSYGIPVNNYAHDTMLLHHSLQPESEKGLGFLGSVYTNEASWKADRPRGSDQTIKKED